MVVLGALQLTLTQVLRVGRRAQQIVLCLFSAARGHGLPGRWAVMALVVVGQRQIPPDGWGLRVRAIGGVTVLFNVQSGKIELLAGHEFLRVLGRLGRFRELGDLLFQRGVGYQLTEHGQTSWNGILGAMRLESPPALSVSALWLYPTQPAPAVPEGVVLCRFYDRQAERALAQGRTVLIVSEGTAAAPPRSRAVSFRPDFWSPMFHTAQSDGYSLGIFVEKDHPLFTGFPTDCFGDWQWFGPLENARGLLINEFPAELRPMVQPIAAIDLPERMAMLFEARVGPGRRLVPTIDLLEKVDRLSGPPVRHLPLCGRRGVPSKGGAGARAAALLPAAALPDRLPAALADSSGAEADVVWTWSAYRADLPGDYLARGTLFVPGAANPGDIHAVQIIRVRPKDMTTPPDRTALDRVCQELQALVRRTSDPRLDELLTQVESFYALTGAVQHDVDVWADKIADAIRQIELCFHPQFGHEG